MEQKEQKIARERTFKQPLKPYDNDQRPKGEQVRDMFDGIAPVYDLLNDVLSLGIARRWRRGVVRAVAAAKPVSILDLATGTGDLALAMARRLPHAHITAADPSEGMLALARKKVGTAVDFVVASAENLPFEDAVFDAVTVSFGVRNFSDIPAALREMRRVLRPQGIVCILEFSTPRNRLWRWIYGFYFNKILPRIGALLSHDGRAYSYLPSSVSEFYTAQEFAALLEKTGFHAVMTQRLTGGVAYIYKGVAAHRVIQSPSDSEGVESASEASFSASRLASLADSTSPAAALNDATKLE